MRVKARSLNAPSRWERKKKKKCRSQNSSVRYGSVSMRVVTTRWKGGATGVMETTEVELTALKMLQRSCSPVERGWGGWGLTGGGSDHGRGCLENFTLSTEEDPLRETQPQGSDERLKRNRTPTFFFFLGGGFGFFSFFFFFWRRGSSSLTRGNVIRVKSGAAPW